jgi:SPP1 gp7 family putative phage head morphogenesis protein
VTARVNTHALAMLRARRAVMALRGKPHRRKRIPRALVPTTVQVSYLASMRPALARMKALVDADVIPQIDRIVRQRGDAARQDDFAADVSKLMRHAAGRWFEEWTNERLRRLARDAGEATSAFQRRELGKQFMAALGIDPIASEPWLASAVEAFTTENVSLITTVPTKYFGEIETTLMRDIRQGARHETIAEDLSGRYDVSESRAALIARDQVLKFNGDLNKTRQQGLGVGTFTWRTVHDSRVREEHADRDGKTYRWGELEPDEEPGQPVQCRCSAEPDLTKLLEEL